MICARLVRATVLGAFVLCANAARGDVPTAEALFREGRELATTGDYAAACAKFEESQRLDPAAGTLLNLGDCSERLGKTASAWAYFLSAVRLAEQQAKTAIGAEARSRAAALEPRLSYLVIEPPSDIPGLRIVRDGVELEPAAVGIRVPVDPGVHVIVAVAPGYTEWRGEVEITTAGETRHVSDIHLKRVVAQKTPEPPVERRVRREAHAPQRADTSQAGPPALAYVAGAVAFAGVATGSVFGVLALNTYADAEQGCDDQHRNCSEGAMEQRSDADTYALASNIGFGVGLVALGAAAYLFLSGSRNEPQTAWRASLVLRPRQGSVRIGSTF
jgi:hypothetical protein